MAESNEPPKPTIVNNGSKAYGYNYSSLADMVKAGVQIPVMRVKPTEHGEYIEYLDDKGEWQLGAKIVVPEMKGCNAAQAYGSALTYARRYTVQLAKSIACDDDSKIEKQPPKRQSEELPPPKPKIDWGKINKIRKHLNELTTEMDLAKYWVGIQAKLNDLEQQKTLPFFEKRKEAVLKIVEAETIEEGVANEG